MQIILILGLCFLSSCTAYVADNKYMTHKINRTQSIDVKFDLLLDEEVSLDDPRVKSIIYASNNKSKIAIVYSNPNAAILANKLAIIFTQQKLSVIKPHLIDALKDHNLNKYVIVYIKY